MSIQNAFILSKECEGWGWEGRKITCPNDNSFPANPSLLDDMVAYNGTYFVCGDNAYPWLPWDWSGSCYLAYVVPYVRHYNSPTSPPQSTPVKAQTSHNRSSTVLDDSLSFLWDRNSGSRINPNGVYSRENS